MLEKRTQYKVVNLDNRRPASAPKRHRRQMSQAAKLAMWKKFRAVWAAKKKAAATRSPAAKKAAAKRTTKKAS